LKTPQTSSFFIFLILLVTALFSSAVLPIHTSPELNLTLNLDKPHYYDGDTVTMYGNLTENGNPVAGLVAIEVRATGDAIYPEGRPYIARAIPTGSDPMLYDEYISIINVWPSDDSGNPLSSFRRGQIAYFKVRIRNTDGEPQLVRLVTLNVFDGNMIPIGVVHFGGIIISPNTRENVTLNFGEIPDDASLGTATVYANHFTDWPHLGGSATGREIDASFQITESGGGGGGGQTITETRTSTINQNPEGDYSTTFNLPLGGTPGYFNVSVNARYHWEQTPTQETSFLLTLLTDVNGNGVIDGLDYGMFGAAWNSHGPDIPDPGDPPSENWNPNCDFNDNGVVEGLDYGIFGLHWGH